MPRPPEMEDDLLLSFLPKDKEISTTELHIKVGLAGYGSSLQWLGRRLSVLAERGHVTHNGERGNSKLRWRLK